MNGGPRGYQPPTNCLKNVDQMEKTNSYRNGIPKDLPNRTKGSHWISAVDEKQAEESLSLYCKPVELYNIIQERSKQQPLFLQRCLSYKISAAFRRRIKMTISVTGYLATRPKEKETVPSNGSSMRSVFVMVTRPVKSPVSVEEVEYRLRPVQILKVGGSHHSASTGISFILPELGQLVQDAKNGDVILFVMGDSDVGRGSQATTFDNSTGPVVWGKLAMSALCLNWLRTNKENAHQNTLDGNGVESTATICLRHGDLQLEDSFAGKNIRFSTMAATSAQKSLYLQVQLEVLILGVEVGQTIRNGKPPTNGTVPKSALPYSLSHAWRPRIGRVVFHYLYYHGVLRKTEVTENFSCPFCLNHCASFKGLRGHLNASHDLFNFEYLVSGELQVVNVTCRPEVVGPQGNIRDVDGLSDPRVKNFSYWFPWSRLRRRRLPVSSGQHLQDEQLPRTVLLKGASDLAEEPPLQGVPVLQQTGDHHDQNLNPVLATAELVHSEERLEDSLVHKPSSKVPNGLSMKGLKHGDDIPLQQEHKKPLDNDGLGLVGKQQRSAQAQKRQRMKGVLGERTHSRSRPGPTFGGACASAGGQDLDDCGQQQGLSIPNKAAVDRPDIPRTHALLQKRQYFHSHTAQPMDAEQLFGDRDSEDEVDPVIADLEDRRMLDDFVDVTPEEKEIMHLWNSFVRRNRVVADGHCPWACGEFSRENAHRFGENPALRRCLMLFLVKLWNHHLVDGPTISKCLTIVDSHALEQQEEPKN
ncbi:unnamed protein product [Calypogeia fissa]